MLAKRHGVTRQTIWKYMDARPIPEFDADGYPTEATLDVVRNWKASTNFAVKDFFAFLREAWRYPERWRGTTMQNPVDREQVSVIRVSTGGWSGNEDLIDAMQENTVLWTLVWEASFRGGGFVFRKRPYKGDSEDD